MSGFFPLNCSRCYVVTALLVLGLTDAIPVHAQQTQRPEGYPSRPIRIVLGISPGGGTDIVARAVAQKLTERWGRAVVVDNRTGAAGTIAFELVAQAAPDGYTHYFGTLSNVVMATLLKKVAFDTRKAYAPVVQMTTQPYVLIVIPSVPAKTLKEFIAYAKNNPNGVSYASSGVGTMSHLGMELFKSLTGAPILHVPYKGVSVGLVDMIGGQIQSMIGSALTVSYHVKGGRLRPLAITSLKRSPAWPELPTIAESGFPGFEVSNSHTMFAPAGTPAPVVLALNQEITGIMRIPELVAKLAADGAEPVLPNSPTEFRGIFLEEFSKWERFFKTADLKDLSR